MLYQLDRIVIDECHVLLESTQQWRPDILKMTEMTEKGTQVVYLTATLPPILQPAFLHLAGLDARELTICRDACTSRSNIAYQVMEYTRGTIDQALVDLVAAKRTKYGCEAQILVYCPTVKETKRLATLLQCSAYYRDVGTETEKARMVRRFAVGAEKLCTATNMLGLGLNAAGVRVVIHVAMCSLLRHYIQESGRAGRTGLDSESIVMRACWAGREGRVQKAFGYKLEPEAKAFLGAASCRRIVIDKHMDGREDRRQCETGESKCDLCEQDPHGTKRPAEEEDDRVQDSPLADTAAIRVEQERQTLERAILVEQQRVEIRQRRRTEQVMYELERLQQHLGHWSRTCAICMAVRAESSSHLWKECPTATAEQRGQIESYVRFMHRVRWDKYAGCFYCWAPQAICNKWAETDTPGLFKNRGMHVACQYEGVLQQAVAALLAFQEPACRPWLEQQMQRAAIIGDSWEDRLRKWLGVKVKIGQRDASQMCCFLYAWEEGHVYTCR